MIKIEQKKERIANVFEKYFNYFGYKKTSIDEVIKELKISKKTVYEFFENKKALYKYIILRQAENKKFELIKVLKGNSFENLEKLILIYFKTILKFQKLRDKFEGKNNLETEAFKLAFRNTLSDILKLGKEKGDFHIDNEKLTSRFIESIIKESLKYIEEEYIEHKTKEAVFRLIKV